MMDLASGSPAAGSSETGFCLTLAALTTRQARVFAMINQGANQVECAREPGRPLECRKAERQFEAGNYRLQQTFLPPRLMASKRIARAAHSLPELQLAPEGKHAAEFSRAHIVLNESFAVLKLLP